MSFVIIVLSFVTIVVSLGFYFFASRVSKELDRLDSSNEYMVELLEDCERLCSVTKVISLVLALLQVSYIVRELVAK